MKNEPFPTRYRNRERARLLFGDDADRYASLYWASDSAADDVVAWLCAEGDEAKRAFEQALRVRRAPAAGGGHPL
ncbi:MAG: hypothetical protein PVH76_12310, partial [Myxococcales bacterium]